MKGSKLAPSAVIEASQRLHINSHTRSGIPVYVPNILKTFQHVAAILLLFQLDPYKQGL